MTTFQQLVRGPSRETLEHRRDTLIRSLAGRGDVMEHRVVRAMANVPRQLFVPEELVEQAYEDVALSIGLGQTISQPTMVALMTQALELMPSDHVLEVGTGSGYHTAILVQMARRVTSIEFLREHSRHAAERLTLLGTANVHLLVGDGSLGYPPSAPYDAILVAAAGDMVPPPLLEQLAPGGRLVAPVGPTDVQTLKRWRKREDGSIVEETLLECRFVPLVGVYGRHH